MYIELRDRYEKILYLSHNILVDFKHNVADFITRAKKCQ